MAAAWAYERVPVAPSVCLSAYGYMAWVTVVMGGMDYMAGQSAGAGLGSGEGLSKVSDLGNIHDF